MDEKQFKELINAIKKLEVKLDVQIAITKSMAPKPKITSEESKILKLCNSKNSIADMVAKTKKTKTNVAFLLSSLKGKGIIKSVKVKNKLGYTKI